MNQCTLCSYQHLLVIADISKSISRIKLYKVKRMFIDEHGLMNCYIVHDANTWSLRGLIKSREELWVLLFLHYFLNILDLWKLYFTTF